MPYVYNAIGAQLKDDAKRAEAIEKITATVRRTASLHAAAGALGVSYKTFCLWRTTYPELARAVDLAILAR